ncbi:MAG: hypothetical protein AB4290_06045 [Spirulina sp.]
MSRFVRVGKGRIEGVFLFLINLLIGERKRQNAREDDLILSETFSNLLPDSESTRSLGTIDIE